MSLLSLSLLGDTMEKVAQGALWSFTINDGPLVVKKCIDTGCQQSIPKLMAGQGRWLSWHWQPGERVGMREVALGSL